MKRKLSMLLASLAIAVVGLVGCKGPTEEEYKQWAEENGYVVAPTDEEKAQWAEDNGYVLAPAALPAARLAGETSYATGKSGVQINPSPTSGAAKLADYLDREDVIYVDARSFGDYTKGHIEGFECLPYFDIVAGSGSQLFTVSADKTTVTPRYNESVDTMKELLPQPEGKSIFLMCASGGRIEGFMKVLEYCGYDMSRVYNVGGFGSVTEDYAVAVSGIGVTATFTFPTTLTPYTPAA